MVASRWATVKARTAFRRAPPARSGAVLTIRNRLDRRLVSIDRPAFERVGKRFKRDAETTDAP